MQHLNANCCHTVANEILVMETKDNSCRTKRGETQIYFRKQTVETYWEQTPLYPGIRLVAIVAFILQVSLLT